MKIDFSALLCAALVLAAAASPFYSKLRNHRVSAQSTGYFDSRGYYHHTVEAAKSHKTFSTVKTQSHKTFSTVRTQQQSGAGLCQSVRYGTGEFITYLHVCESGMSKSGKREYCFITDGPCCIIDPEQEPSPLGSYKLTLEDFTVNVNYYGSAGALGVCYTLDKTEQELPVCGDCTTPACTLTRCLQNTESGDQSSCDEDGCTCKEGFAPPDCCECDFEGLSGRPHYKDPETGECKPFCAPEGSRCLRPTINGCAQCQPGYTGLDCCECDDGYYMRDDGTCRRPECPDKVVQCTNGVCTCQDGYLPQDCCECDKDYYMAPDKTCRRPECPDKVEECVNGVCTCQAGYLPQDCCECDKDYYMAPDKTCRKPECPDKVVQCTNGVCTCQAGYLPQDCCECDKDYYMAPDKTCRQPECQNPDQLIGCTNGVCTCHPGYLPQNCCDCDVGYYKALDGTCKTPCENVEQCVNGVCTCKEGFKQPDCCECVDGRTYNPETGKCDVACVPEQDIFFVIDTTLSNPRHTFCQTQYSTELLLSAIKPGGSLSGPRVEIDLFPKVDTPSGAQTPYHLFELGTGCEEAIGETLNLVDAFYNRGQNGAQPRSPYWTIVGGELTYPASAIELVKNTIQNEIDTLSGTAATNLRNRRRVVVIFTDGEISTGGENPTYTQVDALKAIPENPDTLNVIAVGNNKLVVDQDLFRMQLIRIAGNDQNVVIADNALDISRGLVRRMAAVGAICPDQEEELLGELEDSGDIDTQCYCIGGRGSRNTILKRQCDSRCSGSKDDCRVPPQIRCTKDSTSDNPYYVASPSYKPPSMARNLKDTKKSNLEEEILQAVEEVLQERMRES